MRTRVAAVIVLLSSVLASAADSSVLRERRQRAASAFHDGILLLHASSELSITGDGFRQNPFFYYFTGLENTVGTILAIDGASGESWLFLPSSPPYAKSGLQPEVQPGPEAAKRLGIEHVVDWSELQGFLGARAKGKTVLYYANDSQTADELPADLLSSAAPSAPLWLQVILQRWPTLTAKEVRRQVGGLMAVQSPDEIAALRAAAKATVPAIMAGMRAIKPGVSQRKVESAVENACWMAGAHGGSFWPWVMSGDNAVFPKPFTSLARYDHLDVNMRAGDLVRLDVGCEWDHYIGDLGRTVPVSGHYTDDQRETWTIFVAAYRAAAASLRAGVTVDQVFEAWQKELLSHRGSTKSPLAKHAIEAWSDRKNVPFWQVHLTNLDAGYPPGPLQADTTINLEPIASVDGQGFFLEDMYLITNTGAELLTPGVPYSADQIEAAMRGIAR